MLFSAETTLQRYDPPPLFHNNQRINSQTCHLAFLATKLRLENDAQTGPLRLDKAGRAKRKGCTYNSDTCLRHWAKIITETMI